MFHTSHLSADETPHIGCWGPVVFSVFGVGFGFGLCVFLVAFGLLPLPISRVSILSMMTWAHRPHGVRTRGEKR